MFDLMLQNPFAAIGVNVLAMLLMHVLQRENDAACAVVFVVLSNALQKCKNSETINLKCVNRESHIQQTATNDECYTIKCRKK